MASETTAWDIVPLDDLTEEDSPITYGVVKPGEEGDVAFVRGGDIAGGRVLTDQLRTIGRDVSQQYRRTLLRGGEILVSLVGNPGQVAIAPSSLAGANIARQVGLVRLKRGIDTRYVSYFLQSRDGQAALGAQSLGSVQQVINLRDLKTVKVPLPPIAEQKAIAEVLGALDDKIEVNRRMNATLEAMARALFQSWFVDFDPVRAKVEGRPPAGLDEPTAALFPAQFQDSNFGPIPQGWKVSTIDEAVSLIIDYRGKTPAKLGGKWSEGGIPAVSAKNVKNGRLVRADAHNFVDEALFERWMKEKLAIGDILMTSEAPLGELYYLMLSDRYCLSQRVYGLRANRSHCDSSYLYLWLESAACQIDLSNRATGSTVVGIRQTELRKVTVLLPSLPIQKAAAQLLRPWLERVHRNEEECRTLATLRDTLLPKLLRGDLNAAGETNHTKTVQ